MKFVPSRNTVVSSGETKGFSMAVNAKSFSILTSGIYKNKVKAIIREYSTNAIDSHFIAKQSRPFEVHLPTEKEQYFYVQDYGLGLDQDEFDNVFFRFFESTKDNSNDLNGCLGLGCKSGFSYNTKSFTVESVKDGIKYIYSCFIGKTGEPEQSLLYSGESTEPNGVKVQIPVSVNDIDEFEINAQEVYQWFENKPVFVGKQLEFKDLFVEQTDNCGILNVNQPCCYAVMANVAYPIEYHYSLAKYNDLIRRSKIAFFFDVGEISFTPSRETLEYTDRTLNAIKNKIEKAILEVKAVVEQKVNSSTSEWEAICKYNHLFYAYNTKFHGIYNNKPEKFDFNGKELSSVNLTVLDDNNEKESFLVVPFKRTHSYRTFIELSSSNKYVINDMKVGAISRCKLLAEKTDGLVYLFDPDQIPKLPAIHETKDFILASTLPKPVRNTTNYNRSKFGEINLMKNQYRLVDGWEGCNISSAKSKYYIIKSGYRPAYYGDHRDINENITPAGVYNRAINAGITDPIYGVTEKNEKELVKLGWIKIQDAIQNAYSATQKEVESEKDFINKYYSIQLFLSNHNLFINNLGRLGKLTKDLQKILDLQKDYSNNAKKLETLNTKIVNLMRCISNYKYDYKNYNLSEYENIIKRYPLLENFNCNSRQSGYNTINAVDFGHYILGVDYASGNI